MLKVIIDTVKVKATIVDLKPDVEVSAKAGVVSIWLQARSAKEVELIQEMEGIVRQILGLKELKIEVRPSISFGD